MIDPADVSRLVLAMVPLYGALVVGFCSTKWWGLFTSEQCGAMNKFVSKIINPFLIFHFVAGVDLHKIYYRFLISDALAKGAVGVVLLLWVYKWPNGNLSWSISTFSFFSITNELVVGTPLLWSMYGSIARDMTIQYAVIQYLLWAPLVFCLLEYRQTSLVCTDPDLAVDMEIDRLELGECDGPVDMEIDRLELGECDGPVDMEIDDCGDAEMVDVQERDKSRSIIWLVMVSLAQNPSFIACVLGLAWAIVAQRWNVDMSIFIDAFIVTMSNVAAGSTMFTIGMFIGLGNMVSSGWRPTVYGLALKFFVAPLIISGTGYMMGLRAKSLRAAILQAVVPYATTSFTNAQAYNLHSDIVSTVFVFGYILSPLLLIGYYVILGMIIA